jgi:hypothetical protein
MTIATWQQGRRDEARSWCARADRFMPEENPGDRNGLGYCPPPGISGVDWWRLLIARRLLFDADFPADPFAH